jgi:alkylated DNA nucleotide flippase Atl1
MLQIQRLRQEGVEVDAVGNLDLRRYQWRGGDVDEPR